jgi:hypothetical protein
MTASQTSISIVPVQTARQRRQFVELPYSMYAGDPMFVPPLRRDEYRRLDPRHNPMFEHASIQLWLAMDGGRPVGRIAAIDDRLHNEVHHERTMWFGFFEARDADVAAQLLSTVEAAAARAGHGVVRGPVNASLHEAAGLLIDGFDDPPAVMMPYNPPSYPAFIEGAGYTKAKDLFSWVVDLETAAAGRMARIAERVRKRSNVRIRSVDMSRFDAELDILKVIYRSAWAKNWGFVPPTEAEIRQLALDLKPIVDPELVIFAEVDGRPVACAVGIPDVNQVLAKMNGRLFPFGLFHFLRRRRIYTRTRMLMLGVVPDARMTGLYPLLVLESAERGAKLGYRCSEVGWTLEDNHLINAGIEAAGGVRTKVYRLYDKPVG